MTAHEQALEAGIATALRERDEQLAACAVLRAALVKAHRGEAAHDELTATCCYIGTALATAGAELAAAVRALLEVGVDVGKNLGCTCPKPCPRCLLAYRQLADALASPALRPFHRA